MKINVILTIFILRLKLFESLVGHLHMLFSFRFIVIPSLLPPALLGTVVIIFVFSCLSLALLGMEVLEFEF